MIDYGEGEHTGERFLCVCCGKKILEQAVLMFPARDGAWVSHLSCGMIRREDKEPARETVN